jgi:hypothetical protein
MQYTNTQINKHLWSDYGYCIKDYNLSLNGLSLHIFFFCNSIHIYNSIIIFETVIA